MSDFEKFMWMVFWLVLLAIAIGTLFMTGGPQV